MKYLTQLYDKKIFLEEAAGCHVNVLRYADAYPEIREGVVYSRPVINIRYSFYKGDGGYTLLEVFPCDDEGRVHLNGALVEEFEKLNISWSKVVRSGSF